MSNARPSLAYELIDGLAAIAGQCELLADFAPDPECRRRLALIELTARRLAQTVLARQQELECREPVAPYGPGRS